MNNNFFRKNILIFLSFLFAISVYFWSSSAYPLESLKNIRLTQIYAISALFFLYLTILSNTIIGAFPNIKYKNQIVSIRPSLFFSTLFFILIHAFLAFFKELGGFSGLAFITQNYIFPVVIGITSLFLIFAASFFLLKKALGKLKKTYRTIFFTLLYISGLLTIVHALVLGTHFASFAGIYTRTLFFAVSFLVLLEAVRLDRFLKTFLKFKWNLRLVFVLTFCILELLFLNFITPTTPPKSVSIHTLHYDPSEVYSTICY